jgi:hypothetical protein
MEWSRPRDIVPYETPRATRREQEREASQTQFQVRLAAAITDLRLSNAYQLTRRQIEMHIALGEEIASKLAVTDNPIVQLALKRVYEQWLTRSESIVTGY